MIRARVLGIPHIEHGEITFAVWVQGGGRTPEVVQVSTNEPNSVFVDSHGHDEEVVAAARDEVERWVEFQRRFMDRLYAKLQNEKRQPIQSHVRETGLAGEGRSAAGNGSAD